MKPIVRIALVSLVGTLAFASSKVASDVPATTASGMVDVIVQYRAFPNQGEAARIGQVHRTFRSIPAVHMTVPFSSLASLAADPRVAYISPNRKTTGLLDITTQTVKANQLWQSGFDGSGVGIAVIDSGVAAHSKTSTPKTVCIRASSSAKAL